MESSIGVDDRVQPAELVGQNKIYITDIMQTTKTVSHHNNPDAKPVITERECRDRAQALILACSNAIKAVTGNGD